MCHKEKSIVKYVFTFKNEDTDLLYRSLKCIIG